MQVQQILGINRFVKLNPGLNWKSDLTFGLMLICSLLLNCIHIKHVRRFGINHWNGQKPKGFMGQGDEN